MMPYRVVKVNDLFYAQRLTVIGWGSFTSTKGSKVAWADDWKYEPIMTGNTTMEAAIKKLIEVTAKKLKYKKEVVMHFSSKKAVREFAEKWGGKC